MRPLLSKCDPNKEKMKEMPLWGGKLCTSPKRLQRMSRPKLNGRIRSSMTSSRVKEILMLVVSWHLRINNSPWPFRHSATWSSNLWRSYHWLTAAKLNNSKTSSGKLKNSTTVRPPMRWHWSNSRVPWSSIVLSRTKSSFKWQCKAMSSKSILNSKRLSLLVTERGCQCSSRTQMTVKSNYWLRVQIQ